MLVLVLIVGAVIVAFIWATRRAGPRPATLLVCGATGVGKSTLINALAGRAAAATGIGVPVTQNTTRIYAPEVGFVFYDSRGMEILEASQSYLLLLSDLLNLRYNRRPRDQVDFVLMCIQEPQGRIDDAHVEIACLCEDLAIPFGIALTKTEGETELLEAARAQFTAARFVIPVRALPLQLGSVTIPAAHLPELTEALRSHCRWDREEAIERSKTAMKTEELARAARTLATTQGGDDAAWCRFADASFSLLTKQIFSWPTIRDQMGGTARKAMVKGFFKRVFGTKFDHERINGAHARGLVPYIIRRFGDRSSQLQPADIEAAQRTAMTALDQNRPFRSRF